VIQSPYQLSECSKLQRSHSLRQKGFAFDRQTYNVAERLENNIMMRMLALRELQQCQNLVGEIAHAAQGVLSGQY